MIAALKKRTRASSIRLIIVMVLFMLSGSLLAVMIRKEQVLKKEQAVHRTIVANLPRMAEDTRQLRRQVQNFRRLVPDASGGRSTELLLLSRLDQVKAALPTAVMTASNLEKKDGAASVGFSLKMPLQEYATAINSIGRLQTETFPFVVIKKVSLDALAAGQLSVDGVVLLPLAAEGAR
jgi:hypothetical protein